MSKLEERELWLATINSQNACPQWKSLWRTFRGLRTMMGQREVLDLIGKNCRREALLILEAML